MRAARRFGVVLALCGATALAAARLHVAEQKPYDVTIIPRASVLRWASLGHPTLASNAYWLRTVQYLGDLDANQRGWERLFPLVDLVTDLDPGHGYAYQVAGVMLGSVGRVDESNAILGKGMRNVPNRYILPFLRAFNAFYYADDFATAGRYVEIAAKTPGAPEHLRQNVLAFYVKGREAEAAISFLERLRGEARDPETANALDKQLAQAYLERDAAVLEDAVAEYRRRFGTPPAILEQLVGAGLVAAIPPDPFGGVYVLGFDGRVRSTVHDYRIKPAGGEKGREPGVTPESGYPGSVIQR